MRQLLVFVENIQAPDARVPGAVVLVGSWAKITIEKTITTR